MSDCGISFTSPVCDVAQMSNGGISFISPFCDIAQMSDCGISFISPVYDVAQISDSGISFKPFMWCRLDARLRHTFYLFTFRGVAPDTRSVFSYLFYLISHEIILLLR